MNEIVNSTNGMNTQNDFVDYTPVSLNVGVWFTALKETKTTVSMNRVRDAIELRFVRYDNGIKVLTNSRIPLNQARIMSNMFRAILADRLAIAKAHYSAQKDGPIEYTELQETNFKIDQGHIEKGTREWKSHGELTFSTCPIDGVNRVAINMNSIDRGKFTVVFFDDFPGNVVQVSEKTVIDPKDLDFYRFCEEFDNLIGGSLIYAGFDKLYQLMISAFGFKNRDNNNEGFSNNQNSGQRFFGNLFRRNSGSNENNQSNGNNGITESEEDLF